MLAPITTFAPLAVGKTIELYGTVLVFGVCLVPTVLGLVWLAGFVRDPDAPNPAEAQD